MSRRLGAELVRVPTIGRIDRHIATAFLSVATALMAAVFVAGSALYLGAVRHERERVSGAVAGVIAPALEGLKSAGEYRMQRLAEALVSQTPTIAFIRVVDENGAAIVQAGHAVTQLAAGDRAIASRAPQRAFTREIIVNERPVTEVIQGLRAGYQGTWRATLRVGIWGETPTKLLLRAGMMVGGLLAVLLALSLPVVVWLSRRLGAPLQALAQDFEGVMRHAPLHITIEDARGRIEAASDKFLATFRVSAGAETRTADIFPPEVIAANLGEPIEVEMLVGGERRVFLTSRFPVAIGRDHTVLRAGIISTDVTDRRHVEAERDQMVAAIESTGDEILVASAVGGVIYANPAFSRRTGLSRDEALGRDPMTVLAGVLPDGTASQTGRFSLLSSLNSGMPWQGRITARRRDGTGFPCDVSVFPIRDGEGSVQAQVWSARDVSRQAELEAQLQQAQRMEATGRLAGGVAHDFNNLLTVINGMAEILQRQALSEQLATPVRMIREAGRRAAVLTRQLLAFGRRQTLNIQQIDLNAVLNTSIELLRSAIGTRVTLEVSPAPDLWPTRGDVGQIEQALMNLAINARDAIAERGTLKISTENSSLRGVTEADGTEVPDGDYVMLTVSDTGAGMQQEVLQHIFEPFFTTKEVGKGTGLGLAMVHGMVRQSGGHLWVFSEPGVGTTFRLAFPRSRGESAPRPVPSPPPPSAGGEHVLVVDDEDDVRQVIVRMLEEGGYRVTGAAGGEAALELIESARPPVELLITDLMMPGMSGVELARTLSARRPSLPRLFMSGYSAQSVELMEQFGDQAIIQKPPSASTLLATVREALDARAADDLAPP